MNPLIDEKVLEAIRTTGNTAPGLPPRVEVLDKHGLPYDRQAENVIVSGCQILYLLPHMLSSLARVLDRGGLSYTFLSREYCCGNYLYRPAIKARDEEALSQCRELSREFVALNLTRAKELGAKRLVVFCSPCYPIYKHAFPGEDIIFYPRAVAEAVDGVPCEKEIDYYAGCYRLHRRFSPVPMGLESTEEVFSRLKGPKVNRIGAPPVLLQAGGDRPPGRQHPERHPGHRVHRVLRPGPGEPAAGERHRGADASRAWGQVLYLD